MIVVSFIKKYWLPILTVLYLVFAFETTGIRPDHYALVVLVNSLFFISPYTKRMITGLSVFVVYWMIFDSMKAWPNYKFSSVDIEPIYLLEKKLFGIFSDGKLLTPNEYWVAHATKTLDITCSLFYLCWMPIPLLFSFYLYFTNKNLFLRFCLGFFVVNLVGFVVYYTHPAAPPWYYHDFGNHFFPETKSNAAGLLRFDEYFNTTFFADLYSKGSNVFAAMPSLHSSYPLIGLFYAFKQNVKAIKVFYVTITLGIWFSAIYLNHHYTLDVIAGILCAIIGLILLEHYLLKVKRFRKFFNRFYATISIPVNNPKETIVF